MHFACQWQPKDGKRQRIWEPAPPNVRHLHGKSLFSARHISRWQTSATTTTSPFFAFTPTQIPYATQQ